MAVERGGEGQEAEASTCLWVLLSANTQYGRRKWLFFFRYWRIIGLTFTAK